MAELEGNQEIHYVFGDQQFVLDQEDSSSNMQLGDIICSDGSRAILVDGQYLLTDSQAILLQEAQGDLTQYYIDNSESFVGVVPEDVNDDGALETTTTEIIQLVEDGSSNDQQIIYYTSDDAITEQLPRMQDIEGEDGNIYHPFKRIKLQNIDDLVDDSEMNIEVEDDGSGIEYAVVNDERYPILTYQHTGQPSRTDYNATGSSKDKQLLDLSKITGRNLITGQTVTLHSYMEKLKKKFKTDNIESLCADNKTPKKMFESDLKRPNLNNLLDKKISIGKTKDGKKIVGRIIDVKSVKTEVAPTTTAPTLITNDENRDEDSVINDKKDETRTVAEEEKTDDKIGAENCIISNDKNKIEEISKTLGGVMEMESVRKKLENKNIVVKLVERIYEANSLKKTSTYSYGYMEKENVLIGDEVIEKWKFVPEEDNFLDDELGQEVHESDEVIKQSRFSMTTSLTIVISQSKSGHKTIRVNLNPSPGNFCTICSKHFKTSLLLRQHMDSIHNCIVSFAPSMPCEVCGETFEETADLMQHKNKHIEEGKLFTCTECNKCFRTQSRLQKHLPVHDVFLRPLECSVCEVRCASQWALKKHLLTHTGIKPFSCDLCPKQFLSQYDLNFHRKTHFHEKQFACSVCLKSFSRHSNLLRHMEIHKGSGALYKCKICSCSYNYISSLTRHLMQNHIDAKKNEVVKINNN